MFKIPLESYRSPAGPHAVIDLDDEGGRVRLVLELEPGELAHRRRLPDLVPPEAPLVDRLAYLAEVNGVLSERLMHVEQETDVSRDLTAVEAREVAAALWHYAGEVDSIGRRA